MCNHSHGSNTQECHQNSRHPNQREANANSAGSHDNDSYKKPKYNQGHGKMGMIPEQLYKLKQSVIKKMPWATLSRILKEGGHDVQALICTKGIPITTCCHLAFWGACPDTNCSMAHDKITLSLETIDKAITLLKPGATKLANHTPKQD